MTTPHLLFDPSAPGTVDRWHIQFEIDIDKLRAAIPLEEGQLPLALKLLEPFGFKAIQAHNEVHNAEGKLVMQSSIIPLA